MDRRSLENLLGDGVVSRVASTGSGETDSILSAEYGIRSFGDDMMAMDFEQLSKLELGLIGCSCALLTGSIVAAIVIAAAF